MTGRRTFREVNAEQRLPGKVQNSGLPYKRHVSMMAYDVEKHDQDLSVRKNASSISVT